MSAAIMAPTLTRVHVFGKEDFVGPCVDMVNDTGFIREEIARLEAAGDVVALAKIAISLVAEVEDLTETPLVVLGEGEEWPKIADLPQEEGVTFSQWLGSKLIIDTKTGYFLYYPWHLAQWRAETQGT